MSYDANSTDSMLSKILERMTSQDAKLESIHAQCIKTNGRVTMLESFKNELKGKVAILAAVVSTITAWIIKRNG